MRKLNNKGMALMSVIGIMGVIAVLATGLFYFSSNELALTSKNTKNIKAQYLARAGVEIASKSFPTVAGNFGNTMPITKDNPVKANLYFHLTPDINGNMINEDPIDAQATIEIDIYPEKRRLNVINSSGSSSTAPKEQEVFVYSTKVTYGDTKGKAQGYTVPPAKLSAQKDISAQSSDFHLNWLNSAGVLDDGILPPNNSSYIESTSNVDKSFWQGLLNIIFTGSSGEVSVYSSSYNGVVSITESDITSSKIKVSNNKKKSVFAWIAPAFVIDVALDMTGQRDLAVLGLTGDTLVFGKPITVYRSSVVGTKAGNIILKKSDSSNSIVWFKSDVYYAYGSKKILLIPKGKYELLDNLDMISYYEKSQAEKEKILKLLSDDVSDAPTISSLTKIVWE